MKFLKYFKFIINLPLFLIASVLIYFYKFIISPFLPSVCGYFPTCSNYMFLAIKKHGTFKGINIGIKRLLRCNGKHGGYDPVPENIKGDFKWIA